MFHYVKFELETGALGFVGDVVSSYWKKVVPGYCL